MRAFQVSDGAFVRFVDIAGREPVRVYLHGLARSSSGALAHIAAHRVLVGHRSLLVDLLGFGYSDRPASFGIGWRTTPRPSSRSWMGLGSVVAN